MDKNISDNSLQVKRFLSTEKNLEWLGKLPSNASKKIDARAHIIDNPQSMEDLDTARQRYRDFLIDQYAKIQEFDEKHKEWVVINKAIMEGYDILSRNLF